MQTALNQSLAALRGWVSYGEENFREERRQIWLTRIEPELAELRQLSEESKVAGSAGNY